MRAAGYFFARVRVEVAGAPTTTAVDAITVTRSVKRLAHEIAERNTGAQNLVLIGIVRRGAALAERLTGALEAVGMANVPVGTLDISSYRDDGRGAPGDPCLLGRDIPFALDRTRVVLVDDVLYTGRTVRAALDALADLGQPESIQLAVLVDRGERELPIRADYVGRNIEAPRDQRVYVRLAEVDGVDEVVIGGAKRGAAA
ncbi:MAG TPA: bifunctional pyr operon transcriptional regulator/uracil phosphoribosyltransferase PyrR [Candidatus Binataceae bacterium]|nr:bifunctional pyr operon transcriptional regulator/uracil phosphoribosyltransferase PyrR [Candidatus Binataceae bacterium]